MSYKRDIENTTKAIFEGDNYWQIPNVKGSVEIDFKQWQQDNGGVAIPFNYARTYITKAMDTSQVGVHFFLPDYQFERLWQRPEDYVKLLAKYKYVCAPDFSMYTDHPRAIQMYSHYKKQWLSAYWEHSGITVVPTVCWSDNKSYEWCFDGMPHNSAVAISTKGTQVNTLAKERFYAGYYQMLKRLEPTQVLLFGKNPGALDGNIVEMGYEFSQRMKIKDDG